MHKNELARKLFYSLERDSFYPHRYIVLSDQNYVTSFHAGSDAEAIEIFETKKYMEV